MRTVLILAAMLALAACTPERAPPEPVAGSSAPEVAPASESEQPAGSQYDPINRANAVEGDVIEQQQSQDKAMEEQGG